MKKHIQPIAWIASVSFLVLILAGTILTGRSNAQTKKFSPRDNKLSAELEKRARAHNADEDRVKIVLQLNKKPSGQFGALLGRARHSQGKSLR